jgi:demethylmenaquinone methyltransferase/2-methoxy-6-polyprenyl-1,4-benzoquinol methylase
MPDPDAVNSMFSRIACRYDLANRLLSGGIDVWWRHRLVAAVQRQNPRNILDLATGSGDVAFALSQGVRSATEIVGVDFCQPMLDEAEKKKQNARSKPGSSKVRFEQGDGLALSQPDQRFDAATISFGLRNMANRHRCLSELFRVLKPGGTLFVLEFSQPWPWVRPFYLFYLRRILPTLAGSITGDRAAYQYLNETIEVFPNHSALNQEIQNAGFSAVRVRRMTAGIVALHECSR